MASRLQVGRTQLATLDTEREGVINALTFADVQEKFAHRFRLIVRHLDPIRRTKAFDGDADGKKIGRIYVINLDRKPLRWARIRKELRRFSDVNGRPLISMARRFSAVDARYLELPAPSATLTPTFTLAEQLAVHPNPLLAIDAKTRAQEISMSTPEIAVTLSHVEVWKLIAAGDVENVLVLEDDVVMKPGFARKLDREWAVLGKEPGFDLLYAAYRDVSTERRCMKRGIQRRETPGLWEASAYVLSREGARSLLASLPANGPIDLWLNFQFEKLRVYTTSSPVFEQRMNEASTNSYSVLPVLSQVGAITREKPLVPSARRLPGPIIAIGRDPSEMTSLATALSMLGYSVLHDLEQLPEHEDARLRKYVTGRSFDAFSNIGSIDNEFASRVAARNGRALFIVVGTDPSPENISAERILRIDSTTTDRWSSISDFLGLDYPSFAYPQVRGLGLRASTTLDQKDKTPFAFRDLEWDRSPWVSRSTFSARGIRLDSPLPKMRVIEAARQPLDDWDSGFWVRRDDTFPSNLALFQPANVSEAGKTVRLVLRDEESRVREYSAGAIAARESYLYGSFAARLKPARGSGVITGFFLHRNGPRQEIDIEFRGKDTTKMLVNVFYNPGPRGTRLEYGYRGTPTEIDLGFDAAEDFHDYAIEWNQNEIQWQVDGQTVYARHAWGPTPIPDQPLELNVNIWTSRSKEFAGRLDSGALPATTSIEHVEVSVVDEMTMSSVHATPGE